MEIGRSNGETVVDLSLLDKPLVSGISKRLESPADARNFARRFLAEVLRKANPALKALEEENKLLRKALAFHYVPCNNELDEYLSACGVAQTLDETPPNATDFWVEKAVERWRQVSGRRRI